MTAEGEALLRTPIRELLGLLDPAMFKQVHRSTIVNLKAIASIARDDSGRGTIRLKQRPETLAVSQPFMALFRTMSPARRSDEPFVRAAHAIPTPARTSPCAPPSFSPRPFSCSPAARSPPALPRPPTVPSSPSTTIDCALNPHLV